jgi:hypothetical protein
MSSRSGWVTFWTAVGALGTVAAVVVAVTMRGGPSSGSASDYTQPSSYVQPSSYAPPPRPADLPTRTPRAPDDCTCIGTVRVSPGKLAKVLDAPYGGAEVVDRLRSGEKVRVFCITNGDPVRSSLTGSSSNLWDKIPQGYIPDVLLDTVDERQVDYC